MRVEGDHAVDVWSQGGVEGRDGFVEWRAHIVDEPHLIERLGVGGQGSGVGGCWLDLKM